MSIHGIYHWSVLSLQTTVQWDQWQPCTKMCWQVHILVKFPFLWMRSLQINNNQCGNCQHVYNILVIISGLYFHLLHPPTRMRKCSMVPFDYRDLHSFVNAIFHYVRQSSLGRAWQKMMWPSIGLLKYISWYLMAFVASSILMFLVCIHLRSTE